MHRAPGERGGRAICFPKCPRVDPHGRTTPGRARTTTDSNDRIRIVEENGSGGPLGGSRGRIARHTEPRRRRARTREVAGTAGVSGRGAARRSREGVEATGRVEPTPRRGGVSWRGVAGGLCKGGGGRVWSANEPRGLGKGGWRGCYGPS